MPTALRFTAAAAAVFLATSTAALAGDHGRLAAYPGEAPQDLAALAGGDDRPVTVAGVVQATERGRLSLEDGTGSVAVRLKHARLDLPAVGEEVTVIGRYDDGRVKAARLIRQDGTVTLIAD